MGDSDSPANRMESKTNSTRDSDRDDEISETNPVLEKAWTECQEAIDDGFSQSNPVLIDALPAMGKTRGVFEWADRTGNPLSIFTHRHDLRDEYVERAEKFGLTHYRIPTQTRDCDTAGTDSEVGDEWADRYESRIAQGFGAAHIHDNAERLFGQPLPCQRDGECGFVRKGREGDPRDADVIIGHYQHAHKSEFLEERYVAVDEFPGQAVITRVGTEEFNGSVSAYLSGTEGVPFDNFSEIPDDLGDLPRSVRKWTSKQRADLSISPDLSEQCRSVSVQAPLLTLAALSWQKLANGWKQADLPDGKSAVQSPSTGEVWLLEPPNLDSAESVIALDGTPTPELWQAILGTELRQDRIFADDARRSFLRDGLGIEIVQTSNDSKPYLGGSSITPDGDCVILEEIKRREGHLPSLITSYQALREYARHDLASLVVSSEHYNDMKGSNEFATVRVGAVFGSPQPGDERIQMWGAFLGESVERLHNADGTRTTGRELDFGSPGNAILQGLRDNEVLQAAMRFGRVATDGQRGARVYVHTAAIPEWVNPEVLIAHPQVWDSHSGGMRQVIDAVCGWTEWRTKDVVESDCVSVTAPTVRNHLHSLEEYGFIERESVGRGYTWRDLCLDELPDGGHVTWEEHSPGVAKGSP